MSAINEDKDAILDQEIASQSVDARDSQMNFEADLVDLMENKST